jgi:cytoskeleton protein RodZ
MSLEALERGDLSRLPGGIFTRAFIRAYAKEVGLDPDRTIQDFIAELPPEAVTATARSTSMEDGEKLESDRKAVSTAFRLIAISIPIVAVVMYFSTHAVPVPPQTAAGEEASARIVAEASLPVGARDATQQTPAVRDADIVASPAAQSSPAPVAAPSGLTMEMAPKGACWVSVTVDGDPTFSVLMNAGERRQVFAREEVLVTVGDAGAFSYSLNGRPGRPLGGPGEVVSRRINLSNYRDLVIP